MSGPPGPGWCTGGTLLFPQQLNPPPRPRSSGPWYSKASAYCAVVSLRADYTGSTCKECVPDSHHHHTAVLKPVTAFHENNTTTILLPVFTPTTFKLFSYLDLKKKNTTLQNYCVSEDVSPRPRATTFVMVFQNRSLLFFYELGLCIFQIKSTLLPFQGA